MGDGRSGQGTGGRDGEQAAMQDVERAAGTGNGRLGQGIGGWDGEWTAGTGNGWLGQRAAGTGNGQPVQDGFSCAAVVSQIQSSLGLPE